MKIPLTCLAVVIWLSAVLANVQLGDVVNNQTSTPHTSTTDPPVTLNETDSINVYFTDLSYTIESNAQKPRDTFVFTLNTTSSKIPKKDQVISFDVTTLRKVINPKLPLAIKGCDWSGKVCSPRNMPGSTTQTFDKNSLASSNIAKLKVADFGKNGNFFYIYLQVSQIPGKDNPNYDTRPFLQQTSPDFKRIISDHAFDDTQAMTIALQHI